MDVQSVPRAKLEEAEARATANEHDANYWFGEKLRVESALKGCDIAVRMVADTIEGDRMDAPQGAVNSLREVAERIDAALARAPSPTSEGDE